MKNTIKILLLAGVVLATTLALTVSKTTYYKLGNSASKTVTIASGDTVTYLSLVTIESVTVYNIDSVRNNMHINLSSATKADPGDRLTLVTTCAGTGKALYFSGNLVNRDTVNMTALKTYVIEFVSDGIKYYATATAHRAY